MIKKRESKARHILRVVVEKPGKLGRQALVFATDIIEVPHEMYRRARELELE